MQGSPKKIGYFLSWKGEIKAPEEEKLIKEDIQKIRPYKEGFFNNLVQTFFCGKM